jgi:cystathionine beta-lyase
MQYDFDQVIDRRGTNSIKWTHYPDDVLPFWVADLDFRAPEPVLQALRSAVAHGIFGYESPPKILRETVAARMQKLYGWDVTDDMVLAVTGIVSGFYVAAAAFCQPGDGYLIQPPVYMPFNDIQKHLGIIRQEARLVKADEGHTVRYQLDWDSFEAAFDSGGSRTRMFLLCNPHNPTGGVYTREELSRMAEVCLKHDLVIVSDEIHSELLLGGSTHVPIATLSPEIAERSVTLVSPSKTFNIPGLFCGFAIIPNARLRERYKLAIERMVLHVNSLGLAAAQAALSGSCDDWLGDLLHYLTANRGAVVDFVGAHLPGLHTTVPDATYLAWFDCAEAVASGKITSSPFNFFLERAKVALNDGATFGTGGDGFVRFNFGAPRALVLEGLERMARALA